jgi:hypothetical protein
MLEFLSEAHGYLIVAAVVVVAVLALWFSKILSTVLLLGAIVAAWQLGLLR